MVSRATAYRYFPTQEALLVELPLDVAAPTVPSLFGDDAPSDPEDRVALVQNALYDLARDHEVGVALAVIPARSVPDLFALLALRPEAAVVQHGYAHANHAPRDRKKAELGADRKGLSPMDIVAVLTRVVQEQQRALQSHEAARASQENALAALAAEVAALRRAAEEAALSPRR